MCRHNGYILEQIFSPLVAHGGEFLSWLRPLARRCITRGCHHHFRGFLHGRLRHLEGQEAKSAKGLLYAYRVVLCGIHLLQTGEVESNLAALSRHFDLPFLNELILQKQSAETGTLTNLDWAWHREELGRWEQRLNQAHEHSQLPEQPPRDDVDRFLVRFRLEQPGRA
jgi:predicted nucleotidyltransferase